MKKTFTKKTHKNVDYEAIVSLEELKNGLRLADIVSCDERHRNKPIFRDDNSSFTLGRDGRYYFMFTMPEQLVNEIPYQLKRQAAAIAGKIEEALALKR